MRLINSDNLPTVLTVVFSAGTLAILRELFKNLWKWRNGASHRERQVIEFTLAQLEKCHDELELAETEREDYRRQVGRRDHVILSHGLALPRDTYRRGNPDGPVRSV